MDGTDAGATSDGGPPRDHFDAGTGDHVGPNGGTMDHLYFAIVGDTRPPVIDDTAAYPSSTISAIYQTVSTLSPVPSMVVTTGDYVFAKPNGPEANRQFDTYLAARAQYPGVVFPAMGNHECTGATASNCGAGTTDGITTNYSVFLSKLLAPIGQTSPNYTIRVNATDGAWTAKFIFTAGNAWKPSDTAWFEAEMAKPTTYTFVIRHEPKAAAQAPGVTPTEQVMARYPYTLAIVGHTHTYARTGQRQVVIGNGGAPLTGSSNYGFGLVTQRGDGSIQVDVIELPTHKPDTAFRFALHPDGSSAP